MIDPGDPLSRIWPMLAAAAGAFVALSLERFRNLPPGQKSMVVIGGFLGTIFLGPLVVRYQWSQESPDSQIIGAFYFALAVVLMSALPPAVEAVLRWVRREGKKDRNP